METTTLRSRTKPRKSCRKIWRCHSAHPHFWNHRRSDHVDRRSVFQRNVRSFRFVLAVVDPAASASTAILIPPSIAMIVYSVTKMYIQLARNEKPVIEETVMIGFTEKPVRSIILHLLMTIFIVLWSLLLIIPGIIKSYAYSMSFYLLLRKPDLNASEAIEMSKEYTDGRKSDLFMLDLSYLLMYILGIFTLFILWLWIIPKHMTARTLYFDEIYEEKNPVKPTLDLDEEF